MFTLTSAAAEQVLKAAKQGGTESMSLRLAAIRKVDGGIDYRMGFDEIAEGDVRVDCAGIEVIMAAEQVALLDQTTLDYVELEPGQFHFIFLNPKDPNYRPPADV